MAEYLASLPEDRKKAMAAVRKVIRANLPKGIVESMNWGMIVYEVPLKTYPDTYNGQPLAYAGLASQKNYMSVYLMGLYGSEAFVPSSRAPTRRPVSGWTWASRAWVPCARRPAPDVVAHAIGALTLDQFLALHDEGRIPPCEQSPGAEQTSSSFGSRWGSGQPDTGSWPRRWSGPCSREPACAVAVRTGRTTWSSP